MTRKKLYDTLCLGGVGLSMAVGLASLPLAAYMLRHPLAHLLVKGSISSLITGGALAATGKMNLLVVILAGITGIAIWSPFFWWAGARWHQRINDDLVKYFGMTRAQVDKAERLVLRWGFLLLAVMFFLPIPNILIMVLAGASGLKLWKFLVGTTVGAGLWAGVFITAGWNGSGWVLRGVDYVSHHTLLVTGILVMVSVMLSMRNTAKTERVRKAEVAAKTAASTDETPSAETSGGVAAQDEPVTK